MKYRVINSKTKRDITDIFDWVITPNGELFFFDGDELNVYEEAIYILELDYERLCIKYEHDFN